MDYLLDILMITIPSLLVFLAANMVLSKMLNREKEEKLQEIRKERSRDLSPVRLQAYERMILFLERISPNNLVLREHKKSMSVRNFQLELIRAIRTEYEHNLAQQLYISSAAWVMVSNAKEEMLKLVNLAASNLERDATSEDLSRIIIEKTSEVKNLPTYVAIEFLKKEVRRMF